MRYKDFMDNAVVKTHLEKCKACQQVIADMLPLVLQVERQVRIVSEHTKAALQSP